MSPSGLAATSSGIDLSGFPLTPVLLAVGAYLLVMYVALAFWVVRDARLRSHSYTFAAVGAGLGLFLPFIGVLIYILIRPPRTIDEEAAFELEAKALIEPPPETTDRPCPSCGREIERDFVICPYCRTQFARRCHGCQRWLRLGWHVCPYCAEEIGLSSMGGAGRAASS
jgi:RNA polymerase subunit RPABC4/transcription elongation factor Spt4